MWGFLGHVHRSTMTTPLSPTTIQRLAFVRFLHEQGIMQSSQPEPLSAAAVLSFQDAVEHFLLIAADHLKVNLPSSMQFLQYWERLNPALPTGQELPSKQALDRVNKIRVALKHYGTIPSTQAITQARADVSTFFTDATQMIFGVDFASVDMVDLVSREETARLLHDAQTHADVGDVVAALAGLVLAFDELLEYYTGTTFRERGRSPFAFGPRLRNFKPRDRDFDRDAATQLTKLTEVSRQLQQAMQVISLGIDYAKYSQFKALTPEVAGFMDGSTKFFYHQGHEQLTAEDYSSARLFVIESALQAVRADAVLQRRDAHHQAHIQGVKNGLRTQERLWTGPVAASD